ncbi:MAG: TlpA disulfide reductase family protein [Phycisphaerales bacterium]|nr:TlpA disulfide reductase family protein [Phycisphaerales bacterium]
MNRGNLWMTALAAALCAAAPVHASVSIGEAAPTLKIRDWVRGEPVDLAKDAGKRIHVVEFWATWCPPCKASIPLLTQYQKKFGKDLVIVGVTDPDPYRNSPTDIKQFVKEQGAAMDYTVAMDDRGATIEAYMGSDAIGIPQAFVVGKDGKVAWIGSPLDPAMEKVVGDVIAGTYDIAAAKTAANLEQEMGKRFAALDRAYQMGQMNTVWNGLVEITKLDPGNTTAMELMASLYVSEPGQRDVIRKWADDHITQFSAKADAMTNLALILCRIYDLSLRMPDVTLKAAKAAYEGSQQRDRRAVEVYARAFYEIGALDRAISLQEQAVALATGEDKDASQNVLKFYNLCKKLQAGQ